MSTLVYPESTPRRGTKSRTFPVYLEPLYLPIKEGLTSETLHELNSV